MNENSIPKDRLLTSHEVGSLLQMDPSSVVKWVNDGLLPAFRTPGGHRRVRASDLMVFLRAHQMYVPEMLDTATQVLVIDGDENVLKAVSRSARNQEQLAVTTCSSGIDALVRIGAERPQVLVVAAELSEMDGLALVRGLKASARTRGLKVIVATAEPSAVLQKKALEAGAVALVVKPFTAATLAQILSGAPRAE